MTIGDLVGRLLGRTSYVRRLRRRGDAAMVARNWHSAALWYDRALAVEDIPAIRVQRGHALRETGDLAGAVNSYAAVDDDATDAIDARFHRASVLAEQGDRDGAIDHLSEVLRRDGSHRDAYVLLVRLGGRSRVPDQFNSDNVAQTIFRVEAEIKQLRGELNWLSEVSTFSLPAYDAFRHAYPIRPPPSQPPASTISVMVDARQAGTAFLRSTLLSLLDQTMLDWEAVVETTTALLGHPVASLAHVDQRITITIGAVRATPRGLTVYISAGTVLDPLALAWIAFVAARTGCTGLVCDHDHGAIDHGGTMRYWDPRLWGVFDHDIIAQTMTPPALVAIDTRLVAYPINDDSPAQELRRTLLMRASAVGSVAHIPRLLATVTRLPDRAVYAPLDGEIALWSEDPRGAPPPIGPLPGGMITVIERQGRPPVCRGQTPRNDLRCQVVIQTRGGGAMLRTAVESLLATAEQPDALDIIIVDNRSQDAETLNFLQSLGEAGTASIMVHDEPFNWARANNLAARQAASDLILFANDDIEMLTSAWDTVLFSLLQRDGVGAVGTRMLYPDGAIQHAGVLFGIGDGGPIHDGAHCRPPEAGPLDRFDLTRTLPAVTGAFLGVRRSTFDDVQGFDEARFAIGYNDIDFCLRIRETGHTILYTPAIELIHHESKTRGLNVGRSRVAWDIGEMASLVTRWADDAFCDLGYNPQWSRDRAFDGFRNPATSEILDWIDRTARPEPWLTRRRD